MTLLLLMNLGFAGGTAAAGLPDVLHTSTEPLVYERSLEPLTYRRTLTSLVRQRTVRAIDGD
jgi:hypothetical protein